MQQVEAGEPGADNHHVVLIRDNACRIHGTLLAVIGILGGQSVTDQP
jgi:hypothetical protein